MINDVDSIPTQPTSKRIREYCETHACRMRIVAAAANACRLKWGDGSLKSIFLRYLPRYERESDLFLSGLLHLCPFVDLAFEGRIDSEVAGLSRHFRWM